MFYVLQNQISSQGLALYVKLNKYIYLIGMKMCFCVWEMVKFYIYQRIVLK